MFYISDAYLEQLISEDIPYFDLTSHLLNLDEKKARIEYSTREACVLCASEEVARIFTKLGADVENYKPSGTRLLEGESFFTASGKAGILHAAWKVCLNLFDHYSAVATKAARCVDAVQSVAPAVPVLTTRKSMPGTKPLMTKAVITGGAVPHRLGLSETVLIFENHIALMGGFDEFLEQLPKLLAASCEKKVFVEANAQQALQLAHTSVDGIQIEKIVPTELSELVCRIKKINPKVILVAAGGINEDNIVDYAKTGVDGLVTTAIFSAKPLDMTARICPL